MGNEINRDSAVYFDNVLAAPRARLPIGDVQRDDALCVSVPSGISIHGGWCSVPIVFVAYLPRRFCNINKTDAGGGGIEARARETNGGSEFRVKRDIRFPVPISFNRFASI